jgi:hypothetical protein
MKNSSFRKDHVLKAKLLSLLLLISVFIAAGCAGVKLGTLPTPPSSSGLRVFVKSITEEAKYPMRISHEDFELITYKMAKNYFSGKRGVYDIVPLEEVHLITGKEELTAWQWRKDDWALAVEVGRRLQAEYALILERQNFAKFFQQRFVLINVNTHKKFEVEKTYSPGTSHDEHERGYVESFRKLFSDANEDLLATADRKSRAVSSELAGARKEISELTKAPDKEIKADKPGKKPASPEKTPTVAAGSEEKVAALEAKLAKLVETLAQLDEMKKQIEEQRQQSDLLARELAEKEEREKMLLNKLEDSSKTAPVILISSPREDSTVEVNFVQISGVVEDEKGLKRLELYINDRPITRGTDRGIRVAAETSPKRLEFMERVSLGKGVNRLKLRAVDSDDLFTEETVTVHYIESLKNVWAVVIGIDKYPNMRQLKYAVSDAGLFYDHLIKRNRIPTENVVLLVNQGATLSKIRSILGTDLKNKAGKDDMVLIYFAGHGATERDAQSPDGDGLEKYLLPFDADLKDLYATALPMEELSRIFNRIRSERLIFIADACYSGASGGRTIGIGGIRASISEAFIDRIAGGKGRVIMTASGANEVSAEKDELRHGVFTYYLIEGLRGSADTDGDGVVTVDEAYTYVSKQVPAATAQEQHPVKKGTVEGRLILSITQ